MRVLLDTHAFLFAIDSPERLSAPATQVLNDPTVERWVSSISLVEIAIKIRIGKLRMPTQRPYYEASLQALGAQLLPLGMDHALGLLEIPLHHRDPFDRLLIAQARVEGLILVTRDNSFHSYDVECLW